MSKSVQPLVHILARLDATRWRKITGTMAWYYRDTADPVDLPPILDKHYQEHPPTQGDWQIVRAMVNRARAKVRAAAYRADQKAEKERKRVYRREYMRKYRADRKAST